MPKLTDPVATDPDSLYARFTAWAEGEGVSLYPHQDESAIELFTGNNLILSTPTGSGKSMVALAGHFAALQFSPVSVPVSAPVLVLVGLSTVVGVVVSPVLGLVIVTAVGSDALMDAARPPSSPQASTRPVSARQGRENGRDAGEGMAGMGPLNPRHVQSDSRPDLCGRGPRASPRDP